MFLSEANDNTISWDLQTNTVNVSSGVLVGGFNLEKRGGKMRVISAGISIAGIIVMIVSLAIDVRSAVGLTTLIAGTVAFIVGIILYFVGGRGAQSMQMDMGGSMDDMIKGLTKMSDSDRTKMMRSRLELFAAMPEPEREQMMKMMTQARMKLPKEQGDLLITSMKEVAMQLGDPHKEKIMATMNKLMPGMM